MPYSDYEVFGKSIPELEAAVAQDEESAQRLSSQLYKVAANFLRKNGERYKGKFDPSVFGINPKHVYSPRRQSQNGFTSYIEPANIGVSTTDETAEIRIYGVGENFSLILVQADIPGENNDVLLLDGVEGKIVRGNEAYPANHAIITEYIALLRTVANPNRTENITLDKIV